LENHFPKDLHTHHALWDRKRLDEAQYPVIRRTVGDADRELVSPFIDVGGRNAIARDGPKGTDVPVATVALVTVALMVLRRVPVATVALPSALWLAYWFGSLRLIYWRAPDFVPVDNRPLIWLFAFSVAATVLLAMSLLVGLGRRTLTSS
jgi:hypothetical protein